MKTIPSYLIILLTAGPLQACGFTAEPGSGTNNNKNTLAGHYIYGAEVSSFQPCNNEKVFWVNGSIELLGTLEQKHSANTSAPYEDVFLEFVGNFEGKATDGFAMDYDDQIRAEEIILVRKKSTTDCE